MKILITKDEHLQLGFRNKFRKKGWENDVFNKHRFLIDYMQKNNIKYKLTTGDIFDKQTGWTFKQYIKNKEILEMYKYNDIKIISTAGNHDMIEGKTDIKDSVFYEMIKENLLIYPQFKNYLIQEYDKVYAEIKAIPYRIFFDTTDKVVYLNNIEKLKDSFKTDSKHILIIHQNVTPDERKNVTEFNYEEISKACNNAGIDVLITGHYHIGFPTQRINNVLIINPWNLWRVVRDYNVTEEIHTPEAIVYDLEKDSWEHIEVPFKLYKDAFDIKEVDFYKQLKKENKSFFNFAKNFSQINEVNENDNDLNMAKHFIQDLKEKYNLNDDQLKIIIEDLNKYLN